MTCCELGQRVHSNDHFDGQAGVRCVYGEERRKYFIGSWNVTVKNKIITYYAVDRL